METIDMTPSKAAYRRMLEIIRDGSQNQSDRNWAAKELEKLAGMDSAKLEQAMNNTVKGA